MIGGRPVHGGVKPAELRALGLDPAEVLDFSASISPIGPPEGVWEAMHRVDLSAYPDPQCLELRHRLADQLSEPGSVVTPDNLLVGNGSTEIIHLLARAFASSTSQGMAPCVLILTPTYGEYASACSIQGASVASFDAGPAPEFRWDLGQAARTIGELAPTLVFLCNPNNPTGAYLDAAGVEALAVAAQGIGGILVLDEAYAAFLEHSESSPGRPLELAAGGNVVVLRSMTKSYAITGLRIGYSVSSAEITAKLSRYQPDWSVNGLAQAAAAAVLEDRDYLTQARTEVSRAKEYLARELGELGFNVPPSAANFLLVEVGDAGAWRERLGRRGLFVRDCTSFGLPQFIRVGVRRLADCQRLAEAIAALA